MANGPITELLEHLVRVVHRAAPPGWRLGVATGTASAQASSWEVVYTVVDGDERAWPDEALFDLAVAVEAAFGWHTVNLELTCDPSGTFEAVAFHEGLGRPMSEDGYVAVLDPDHRPGEPGVHEPGPGDAVAAGDPTTAVERLGRYLREYARLVTDGGAPNPGASAADVERAERAMGVRLPPDLRALYLLADGDDGMGLFDGYGWLSLDEVVKAHRYVSEPEWFGWDLSWNTVVFDADPPGTVRRCTGHPAWVPFAYDFGGNYLAVDMAPASAGLPGQVIRVGRDHGRGPDLEADSVTELLGRYLTAIDEDDYDAGPDYLELGPAPGPGPLVSAVIGPDRFPFDQPMLEALPGLQGLHLNAAADVDPAVLGAAARLRRFHLNRSVTSDLGPLTDLPLEDLRLTVRDGGLEPLTSHPTLRTLELSTAGGPVRIGPLRTVSQLYGLDLSGAEVADLEVVGELPGLRYLALSSDQWASLSALRAQSTPFTPSTLPGLAAACVTSATSLDAALRWAAGLGLDTTPALRHSGRVTPP